MSITLREESGDGFSGFPRVKVAPRMFVLDCFPLLRLSLENR